MLHAIASRWPTFLSFVLSFLTILVIWMNHHAMFLWVRRPAGPLMVANGGLLFIVVTVPFTTALLGDYLGGPGAEAAAVAYCGLTLLVNLGFVWVWRVVVRLRASIAPDLDDAEVRRTNLYLALGLAGYSLAFALAWWSADAAVFVTLLLALFWAWNAYRRHHVEPMATPTAV